MSISLALTLIFAQSYSSPGAYTLRVQLHNPQASALIVKMVDHRGLVFEDSMPLEYMVDLPHYLKWLIVGPCLVTSLALLPLFTCCSAGLRRDLLS
jgi:hypothetical protein